MRQNTLGLSLSPVDGTEQLAGYSTNETAPAGVFVTRVAVDWLKAALQLYQLAQSSLESMIREGEHCPELGLSGGLDPSSLGIICFMSGEANPGISVGTVVTLDFFENTKAVVASVLGGGMGTIYQLVPIQPARPWALKTFKDDADPEAFDRECRIWLSLADHPSIARAMAYGKWRGRPAILVEWYAATLSYKLALGWSVDATIQLAHGVVTALDYAYSKHRFLHQDIKPANILVDDDGQARLTDFGLVRATQRSRGDLPQLSELDQSALLSIGGPLGGTPLYMAPELFLTGAPPSIITDIYSLGVTLYELLTGSHPYIGPDTGGKFRPGLREGPLAAARSRLGARSSLLIDAVRLCVSLDPEKRPRSYAELRRLLGVESVPTANISLADRVEGIVAQARAARVQGRPDHAATLLSRALTEYPNEPILLNAMGVLLKSQGHDDGAEALFLKAAEIVLADTATMSTRRYPDPVVNLAVAQFDRREFADAHKTLARLWTRWNAGSGDPLRFFYAEFGWMFLFEGKCAQAVIYLKEHLRERAPSWIALRCMVLAAGLSDELESIAPRLALVMKTLPPRSTGDVLCMALVAAHVASHSRRELRANIPETLLAKLREAEALMELPRGSLESLQLSAGSRNGLAALDLALTGGLHVRNIR